MPTKAIQLANAEILNIIEDDFLGKCPKTCRVPSITLRATACGSYAWDHVNFLFFIHKVGLHLPKDYLI